MADQANSTFGADQPLAPAAPTATPGVDPSSKLALLVGEGRKYKTVEDLANAYVHIDGFAETLKSENATLKADGLKAKTIDDVLERLKADSSRTTLPSDDNSGRATQPASLSAADVAQLVRNTMTGLETQRSRDDNLRKADAAMQKLFGDKAKEMFKAAATTSEKRDALMGLAAVAPDQFVALFTPATSTGGQVDSSTSVNTAALEVVNVSGRAADPECKEFYDAMRRKDPTKFYSQAIQQQQHRLAVANRSKYFGNNG